MLYDVWLLILDLIAETIAREKLSSRESYTNFTLLDLFLMVTFSVFRNLVYVSM